MNWIFIRFVTADIKVEDILSSISNILKGSSAKAGFFVACYPLTEANGNELDFYSICYSRYKKVEDILGSISNILKGSSAKAGFFVACYPLTEANGNELDFY